MNLAEIGISAPNTVAGDSFIYNLTFEYVDHLRVRYGDVSFDHRIQHEQHWCTSGDATRWFHTTSWERDELRRCVRIAFLCTSTTSATLYADGGIIDGFRYTIRDNSFLGHQMQPPKPKQNTGLARSFKRKLTLT